MADWTKEENEQPGTITVPLETYRRGCVKDVDEGLEVMGAGKLSPRYDCSDSGGWEFGLANPAWDYTCFTCRVRVILFCALGYDWKKQNHS